MIRANKENNARPIFPEVSVAMEIEAAKMKVKEIGKGGVLFSTLAPEIKRSFQNQRQKALLD